MTIGSLGLSAFVAVGDGRLRVVCRLLREEFRTERSQG